MEQEQVGQTVGLDRGEPSYSPRRGVDVCASKSAKIIVCHHRCPCKSSGIHPEFIRNSLLVRSMSP
jgi:hypothetical protein